MAALLQIRNWMASWLGGSPEEPDRRLWDAIKDGREGLVSELLAGGSLDLNYRNVNGLGLLHLACIKGHAGLVRLLLAHPGIDVNQRSHLGSTPLHLACQWGEVDSAKLLMDHPGARVNELDTIGGTPLWWAARAGHLEVVKWLLACERQAESDAAGGSSGTTALQEAKRSGAAEVALLLENFRVNRSTTIEALRKDLKLDVELAAGMFALVVLYSDEYFQLATRHQRTLNPWIGEGLDLERAARYLGITSRLPMELQAFVALRVYGSALNMIPAKKRENGFRKAFKFPGDI